MSFFIGVVFFIVICGFIASFALTDHVILSGKTKLDIGVSGITETRCVAGYTFVMNMSEGRMVQVLDSFGKGVPCEVKK